MSRAVRSLAAAGVALALLACAPAPESRYDAAGAAINTLAVEGERAEVEAVVEPLGGTIAAPLQAVDGSRFRVVFEVDDRDELREIQRRIEREGLDAEVHTIGRTNE